VLATQACRACGQTKPFEEFPRKKSYKSGFNTLCKACNCAEAKAWRDRDPACQIRPASSGTTGTAKGSQRARRMADPEAAALDRARHRLGDIDPEYLRALQSDPCAYCGAPAGTIDHIVPVASGGPDHWENYTSSCKPCNSSKHARPLLSFLVAR